MNKFEILASVLDSLPIYKIIVDATVKKFNESVLTHPCGQK